VVGCTERRVTPTACVGTGSRAGTREAPTLEELVEVGWRGLCRAGGSWGNRRLWGALCEPLGRQRSSAARVSSARGRAWGAEQHERGVGSVGRAGSGAARAGQAVGQRGQGRQGVGGRGGVQAGQAVGQRGQDAGWSRLL